MIEISSEIRREKLPAFGRGAGESGVSYLNRMRDQYEYIVGGPLGVHFRWYTHQNQAGCWICDLVTFGGVLMSQLQKYYEIEEQDIADRTEIHERLQAVDGIRKDAKAYTKDDGGLRLNTTSPHFKSNSNSKKKLKVRK